MSRAALLILDSVGCGHAPDAEAFGDKGADTLGHIIEGCLAGWADLAGLRRGPLHIPHLSALGLAGACATARGDLPLPREAAKASALYGSAIEISQGKDTPSGHWEICGTPVLSPLGYFPQTLPALPTELTAAILREGHLPGLLGNCHASGIDIIEQFGAEHLASGQPIAYTSIDSVLQIAAHETHFGLERLYELCAIIRRLTMPLRIGRVIARPFTGDAQTGFIRTENRKDFAIPPAMGGLLDQAYAAEREIITLGKIGDIFAHRHTGCEIKAPSNMALFDRLLEAWPGLGAGGLLLANFVDFDTDFGHRRDLPGYAACLEAFDARLPEILALMSSDDLLVVTADHGNDPTWPGSDHTREQIPVLAYRPGKPGGPIGQRQSFADIGQSVARHLNLAPVPSGISFL